MHIGFEHVYGYTESKFIRKPTHDAKFLKKIFNFCEDFSPSRVIFGGDQFDFASLSRFNKDAKIAQIESAVLEEYKAFESLVPPNLLENSVYMIGNHDDRPTEFAAKYPQISGLIDPVKYLGLKDRATVISRGALYNIGKLWFAHGDQISNRSDIAKNAALHYYRNIRFGHFHTYRSYTLHSAADVKDVKTAIAVPAATHRHAAWAKGKPNQCLQGFLYGEVSKKGNFSDYVVVNTPEGFVVNGKRY